MVLIYSLNDTILPKNNPSLVRQKFIFSANDDKAAFRLRDANAVTTFAPISKAFRRFFKTFSAIFLDTSGPF